MSEELTVFSEIEKPAISKKAMIKLRGYEISQIKNRLNESLPKFKKNPLLGGTLIIETFNGGKSWRIR